MKSDRLRTVQLNVCKDEEVEKAVEIIRSSLKDPEKGRGPRGAVGHCTGALTKRHPLFAGVLPKDCFLYFQALPPAQEEEGG